MVKNKNKRMKGIKEKAEENLEQNKDDILCVYDRYAGFVDGANYVLGAIEWLLNSQKFVDNPLQGLLELIEQLKK